MSELDALVTRDLAALADDNRRAPLALGVYRDDRPGARARRDAVVHEQRQELAVMPLALSQVFAQRIGRIAAGAAGVLAAPLSLGPHAVMWLGCVLAVVFGCYIVATSVAQREFERRMRAAIAASDDVHADLDRLAEGPSALARRMVGRADGWAVALGVAGTVSVVAGVGFSVAAASIARPSHNVAVLVGALVVALGWAAVVGRVCAREHRGQVVGWFGAFGHVGALLLGCLLGAGALLGGRDAVRAARIAHTLPATASRIGLVATGTAGLILIATWLWLWWRRREHARIAD